MTRQKKPIPADQRTQLMALVANAKHELIPLENVCEQVKALPSTVTVTVTALPSRGMDATLDVAEWLAAKGHDVVPHLSARLIRDRSCDAESDPERFFLVSGCERRTSRRQIFPPATNESQPPHNADPDAERYVAALQGLRFRARCHEALGFVALRDRPGRTTSTEQDACPTMPCATLPSSHRVSPVRPCEPTTIRSAPHSSASSTMTERGSPSRTAVSVDSPVFFSASAASVMICSALETCCCLMSSSVAPARTNSVAGGVYGWITDMTRMVLPEGQGRRATSSTAACE